MEHNFLTYLIDIAREEAASKEAELHSLRNSLRYQVGGWMLEAFPPRRRTLVLLWRLTKLYLARLPGRGAAGKTGDKLVLPEEALQTTTLVLGAVLPEGNNGVEVWLTDNVELMAMRLDSGLTVSTLILRRAAPEVVRRIARAKLDGAKVIWWPELSANSDPALVAHMRAHADERRDEMAT